MLRPTLPQAGASAACYQDWQLQLRSCLQVLPVELPGKGARHKEPLPTSLRSLAAELTDALLSSGAIRWAGATRAGIPVHMTAQATACVGTGS